MSEQITGTDRTKQYIREPPAAAPSPARTPSRAAARSPAGAPGFRQEMHSSALWRPLSGAPRLSRRESAENIWGFFVLLPLVLLRKKARKEREQAGDRNLEPYSFKRTVKGGIFVGLILLVASTLQQIGIMQVDVGKAGFMTALYIIIVPVLSFFITRRGSVRVFTAAGLAAAGLYFLSFSSAEGFAPADLMLLGCAFAYSMHILCIDHFSKGTDAVELSCIQFLVSGLAGTLISLIVERPVLSSFGMAGWLSLLYAGVFSSGAAYTFQILGQKGADPAIASLILSLESVISAVSGFVLLHQVLTGREIFGCALMFTAIVLVQLPAGRKKLQVPEEKHS